MRLDINSIVKNLCLALLIMLPGIVEASHIIGGEIQYRCLGGNDYEVTVNVYRDCFFGNIDAPFDDPASVGIFDLNTDTLVGDLRIPFVSDDTLDSFLADPCFIVPSTVCVHTTTYKDTVNLPVRTGGYTLVYQRCCRNQTVENIIVPERTGATYNIVLSERALSECNSSPEFREWPPLFICAGTEIFYDHSATDLEGDSLVYSLCTPYTGASFGFPQPQPPLPPPYDTVEWRSTFSLNNILGSGRPLAIDQSTGQLTGRPETQGQFVVGICIEEYRNGTLMSRTIRDFQYNVGMCGMITSSFQSPETLCDTLGVTLENNSQEADKFLWIFDYPNMTYTDTARVPNFTYPDTGSYKIALIAQPGSNCADTSFADIFIQYNSINLDFDVTTLDCADSSQIIINDLSVDSVSPLTTWNWSFTFSDGTVQTSNDQNPVFSAPVLDTVAIELEVLSQNGCVSNDVKIIPTDILDPSSTIPDQLRICQGESVELNPNGDTRFDYSWSPSNTLDDGTLVNPTATPNTTTIYQVDIFVGNQFCTIKKDVEVIVQPQPVLDFSYELGCDNRTVTFTNNSTGSTDFVWNFGDAANTTSTDLNPQFVYQPGTYDVELFLPNSTSSCLDTLRRTIEVNDRGLDADFVVEYENCAPGNLTVNFTPVVNVSGHNITDYNWNFGGTLGSVTGQNQQFTFTNSQTITVELEIITSQGCNDVISKTLDINMVEQLPDNVFQLCVADSLDLNPNFNPDYTYEWSPVTGLSNPNAPNPRVSINSSQNYSVKISAFGVDTCEVVHGVEITVPPAINLQVSGDEITCDSFATIFANTTANPNLEWYDGSTLVGTGGSITVPVSGQKNYMVVAEDVFGCSQTDFVQVAGGPVEVDLPGDQALCIGENFSVGITNLDPNDNLQYSWGPSSRILSGANTPNPVIDSLPGNFNLTVDIVSQYGCTYSDAINLVFVDPAPMDFDYEVQCDGLSVEFENLTTNGFDYKWNFGDLGTSLDTTSVANPNYTYPTLGGYWVLLTIPYDVACRDSVLKFVEVNDKVLEADFDIDYLNCSEDSVTVQFTNTSYSLQNNVTNLVWDFGSLGTFSNVQSQTFTFAADAALNVSLLIENAADCADSLSRAIDLNLFDLTGFPEQPLVQCENQRVFLNPNGNPDYVYEWSPANIVDDPTSHNPEFLGASDAVLNVRILNIGVDTCEVFRQVEVQVPQPIRISNTSDTLSCGFPITLEPSVNVPYDLEWSTIGGMSLGNDPTLVVNPSTNETYVVEAMDNFGCGMVDTIQVINQQVDVQGNGPGGVCQNSETNLSIDNLDANDNLVNIVWMPNDMILSGQGTQNVEINTTDPGTNIFQIMTENQYGCLDTVNIIVGVGAFDPGSDRAIEICAGVETNIYPDFNSAQQYQWSPITGLNDANSQNPRAILSGDITYFGQVTEMVDTLTCIDTVRVDVTVRSPVQLEVTPSDTLCAQQVVTLEVITPFTGLDYQWSLTPDFANIIDNQREIFVNSTGINTYYVRAFSQDSLKCQYGGSVTMTIVPLDVEVDGDTTICFGVPEEISLVNQSSIQNLSYDWSPPNNIVSGQGTANPVIDIETPTTFTVSVENQFGCQEDYDINVDVSNLDDLNVIGEVTATPDSILLGESSQLEVTFASEYIYTWTPTSTLDDDDANNPVAMPEETTAYDVLIEDENGCITTRTVTVVVFDPLCVEPYIFLPNAFSPNGDNNNDELRLMGQFVEEMHLVIFDRWGQKVFESRDQSFGWDGRYKDEELSPDTYGFYLTVKCIDGEEYFKKGNISLIR